MISVHVGQLDVDEEADLIPGYRLSILDAFSHYAFGCVTEVREALHLEREKRDTRPVRPFFYQVYVGLLVECVNLVWLLIRKSS